MVKAMDLKSIGVSPRRFESCPQRFFFFFFKPTKIKAHKYFCFALLCFALSITY